MATVNKLIVITIICNLFIIVGIGHGAGPIGILEPMFLQEIISGETPFTLLGSYSSRLPACALLSSFGQIILVWACFLKKPFKFHFTLLGLGILSFALLALTIGFSGDPDAFGLLFAFPFLYASIRLIMFLFFKSKDSNISDASK